MKIDTAPNDKYVCVLSLIYIRLFVKQSTPLRQINKRKHNRRWVALRVRVRGQEAATLAPPRGRLARARSRPAHLATYATLCTYTRHE